MNDANEFKQNQMCSQIEDDPNKEWEKSKQTFLEWKRHSSPEEWTTMLKTALGYFDYYDNKDSLRNTLDTKGRMLDLFESLDDKQKVDIYHDISKLRIYLEGMPLLSMERIGMLDYFRQTFKEEKLYDYETFYDVMLDPQTASQLHYISGYETKEIKEQIKQIGVLLNENRITPREYDAEVRKLLHRFFYGITWDSDLHQWGMEAYCKDIERSHTNLELSEEYRKQIDIIRFMIMEHKTANDW